MSSETVFKLCGLLSLPGTQKRLVLNYQRHGNQTSKGWISVDTGTSTCLAKKGQEESGRDYTLKSSYVAHLQLEVLMLLDGWQSPAGSLHGAGHLHPVNEKSHPYPSSATWPGRPQTPTGSRCSTMKKKTTHNQPTNQTNQSKTKNKKPTP